MSYMNSQNANADYGGGRSPLPFSMMREAAPGGAMPSDAPETPLDDISPPATFEALLYMLKHRQPQGSYDDQLRSAVRQMGKVLGKPLIRIPTDPALLRELIAGALPATVGMSDQRWTRIRSLVLTALRQVGLDLEPGRDTGGHSPSWRALLAQATKSISLGLSRFASYCSRAGIDPWSVRAETFASFETRIKAKSLKANPDEIYRTAVRRWNEAVSSVPDWPNVVVPIERHPRFYSLPWEAYPRSYIDDVEAYLNNGDLDVFSDNYKIPSRQSTVDLHRRQLRLASGLLVESGFPRENLTSLAVLVRPDNAKAALSRHMERKDGKILYSLEQVARQLQRVAKDWVKDPEHAARIGKICDNFHKERTRTDASSGMNSRNKARLRQFDLPGNTTALLDLPRKVFAEAREAKLGNQAEARRVMFALAVELLTVSAVRGGNLASLDLDRHFVVTGRHGRSIRHLLIPGSEMKGKAPLEMVLPDETNALIDEFVEIYWPRLAKPGHTVLFPNRYGVAREKTHFSQAISQFVKRETGIVMHTHLFRHFVCKLHFDQHPGELETLRRFLLHKSSETTRQHYLELRTDRAFERLQDTIAQQRLVARIGEDISSGARTPKKSRSRV